MRSRAAFLWLGLNSVSRPSGIATFDRHPDEDLPMNFDRHRQIYYRTHLFVQSPTFEIFESMN